MFVVKTTPDVQEPDVASEPTGPTAKNAPSWIKDGAGVFCLRVVVGW